MTKGYTVQPLATRLKVFKSRGQDYPIQIDLARLIRCLLSGKIKNNFNSFNETGLYLLRFCLPI